MYEDKRTIEPSGLLSQASKPAYTPQPIRMTFNQVAKPDATHVNVNKEKEYQRSMQERQLDLQEKQLKLAQQQAAANASKKGGGMSVICTRYHDLGFLSDTLYAADDAFGKKLLIESPELMFWYWSWAPKWVEHCMHSRTLWSQLLIVMFWPLCLGWATEMAYRQKAVRRGSWLGKVMMATALLAFKVSESMKGTAHA